MTTAKQNLKALAALIHAQHVLDAAQSARALADRHLDSQGYDTENIVRRNHANDAVNDAAWTYGQQYWHTCQDLGIDYVFLDRAVETLDAAAKPTPADPDLWNTFTDYKGDTYITNSEY